MSRIRGVLASLKTALWRRPSAGMVIALLAVAAVVTYLAWPESVKWPEFQPTQNGAPAVVIEVERDFGYRIGDPVPVTVYVREQPGTEFDVASLAVEGDFEIRQEAEVKVVDTKDGARHFRVKLLLQSFAYKPQISSQISGSWTLDNERGSKELPQVSFSVYTSRTWDGRPELQEGPQEIIQGLHAYRNIGLLLAAILAWFFLTKRIRRLQLEAQMPAFPVNGTSPRQVARDRFEAVWAKIMAGDHSSENFKEIDLIVRQFLRIETVLSVYVPMAVGENHPYLAQIVEVIHLCERVMYQNDPLSPAELEALKKAFDDFILRR